MNTKEKSYNKVCHDGHRNRLFDLILNAGIENVSNVQAVEAFLCYIIPRIDVNPLAHRLLDRYETFANILDADSQDLKYVFGLNENSIKKIKAFRALFNYYMLTRMEKGTSLKNNKEFLDYLEGLLKFENVEYLYLIAIDNSFNLIQKKKYSLKQVREVGINPLELYAFISSTQLSYLVIAHNHPNGSAISSPDDRDAKDYVEDLLEKIDCKLIDSLVVGEDGIYSESQKAFLRKFDNHDHLIAIFKN